MAKKFLVFLLLLVIIPFISSLITIGGGAGVASPLTSGSVGIIIENLTRFDKLVGNCSSGQFMFGVDVLGNRVCLTDQTGGAGGNPFDQSLNTTESVSFINVTASWFLGYINWSNILNAPSFMTTSQWNATNTTYLRTGQWNATNTTYLRTDQWNSTNSSYSLNQTLTDMWTSFLNTTNLSYLRIAQWNATNTTYLRTDQWNSTNTTYLRKDQWNATNTTYLRTDQWNSTNSSYLVNQSSANFTQVNVTQMYITSRTGACSTTLSGSICRNSTGMFIVG